MGIIPFRRPVHSEQVNQEHYELSDPKAPFWLRILAFLVDSMILGIVGFLLGLVFRETFIAMGQYARWVGFVVSVAYYGILNSKINNGQTLAKRVLRIQVAGNDGRPISLSVSLLRAVVLVLPFYIGINMLPRGASDITVITLLGSLALILQVGLAYFYIFNHQTRQSIHDLVAGTYVILADREPTVPRGRISRIHYIIFPILAVLLLTGIFAGIHALNKSEDFQMILRIRQAVIATTGDAGINIQIQDLAANNGKTKKTLVVSTRCHCREEEVTTWQNKVAGSVLRVLSSKEKFDSLDITINRGYDIGIAQYNRTSTISLSPAQWGARLGRP